MKVVEPHLFVIFGGTGDLALAGSFRPPLTFQSRGEVPLRMPDPRR